MSGLKDASHPRQLGSPLLRVGFAANDRLGSATAGEQSEGSELTLHTGIVR